MEKATGDVKITKVCQFASLGDSSSLVVVITLVVVCMNMSGTAPVLTSKDAKPLRIGGMCIRRHSSYRIFLPYYPRLTDLPGQKRTFSSWQNVLC